MYMDNKIYQYPILHQTSLRCENLTQYRKIIKIEKLLSLSKYLLKFGREFDNILLLQRNKSINKTSQRNGQNAAFSSKRKKKKRTGNHKELQTNNNYCKRFQRFLCPAYYPNRNVQNSSEK